MLQEGALKAALWDGELDVGLALLLVSVLLGVALAFLPVSVLPGVALAFLLESVWSSARLQDGEQVGKDELHLQV